MAQTQTFSIPMANMNLAPSEALNQIMDNLNHLNVIVNQAVNTIHSRIKEESLLLSSISKRVDAAYKKTQLIAQNPNKSTTIYSTANYPVNEDKKASINQPLINKMENLSKPVRSNYNLSLKQRDEKPANVETVSLLQSIKDKTNEKHINSNDNKTEAIPEWVSSVADCMVFGTNRNAYNPRNKYDAVAGSVFDDKRKRKSSMNTKRVKNKNKNDLGPQPSSINDPFYNLKLQKKTYGDRIRYLPDVARKNVPKFKVFSYSDFGVVATDIEWKENWKPHQNDDNDNYYDEGFMIPSEVLNAQFGEIDDGVSFDFGDDIKPPSIKKHARDIDKDEGRTKVEENVKQIHHYPTPNEVKQMVENKKLFDEAKTEQPFIPDVESQNKSLQNEQEMESKRVEGDKGLIDANALQKGKEALKTKKVQKTNNDDEEKKIMVDDGPKIVKKTQSSFIFDANALQKARRELNKRNDDQSRSKRDTENENVKGGVKETIFDAMQKRRPFMESDDEDDDDDDDGSFSD